MGLGLATGLGRASSSLRVAMDRRVVVVAVVLGGGCASRALSDAEAMSADALTDQSTRALLRVTGACDRPSRPGFGLAEFYRCERVYSELVDRYEHRDRRTSHPWQEWVRSRSCAEAIEAVDEVERLGSHLSIGYAGVGQQGRISALHGAALAHGQLLFSCGDAAALERYLEAVDAMNRDPNYTMGADNLVEWLREMDAGQMDHVLTTAPPDGRLALAARRAQAMSPGCPADEPGVIAAMRHGDPMRRALGCSCVEELPEDARAEAVRMREQVIDSDPYVETASTRSGDRRATGRGLAGLPGALVDIALLPLTAVPGESYYPIRLYCDEKRAASSE